MARKSTIVAIAVLIVIVLVLAGFKFSMEVYADTTGHSYYYKGWRGNSIEAGAPHDVLDAPEYVTSWDSRGLSEKIVLYAEFNPRDIDNFWKGPIYYSLESVWYVIKAEGDSTIVWDYHGQRIQSLTFTTPKKTIPDAEVKQNDWYIVDTDMIRIVGPYVGKIHVELWAHHKWLDFFTIKSADTCFASDEAYLRSGSGTVKVPSYVEEGKELELIVSVGYAGDHGEPEDTGTQGWTLKLFDSHGNMVKIWKIPDGVSGYKVKYTIPNGSFDSTPGANNNWKVELWNMLFAQHQEYIVVIKAGSYKLLPYAPKIESLNGEPPWPAGTTLKWRLTAQKNPIGYDIYGFRVSVQYSPTAGQLQGFLIENQLYRAYKDPNKADTWYADIEVVAPQTGFYVLSAQTIDIMNNPSVFTKLEYETGPAGTSPATPVNVHYDWQKLLVGIFALLACIIIGILLMMYLPQPYGLIIGILLIVIGLGIGAWYIMGFINDAQEKGLLIIQSMR